MSSTPTLKRNTCWTTAGQVAGIALQAVYFLLISRTLGSYEYGLFVGVYSLVAVLSPYSTLGFGMLMLRDASRDRTQLAAGWGRSLLALCFGSVLIVALSLIAANFLLHRQVMLVVACIAVADAFCARAAELAGQAFQAMHRLAWTAKLNTLMSAARTLAAASLGAFCWGRHSHASLLSWTLIYTAFSMLAAIAALAIVHFCLVRPAFTATKRQDVREGFSFALSSSSFSIYNDIDKTLLASYGFIQAAGTYGAAYRVIEVATAPLRALYTAAMPRIFERGAKGTRDVLTFAVGLLQWTALYSIGAAVLLYLSAPLLPILLGKSFAGSVAAVRILAFLPLLRSLHYSAGNAISGCASQWYRTSAQLFAAFLNVGLNIALLPHYSWEGAAVASLITDGTLGLINWATLLFLHQRRRGMSVPIGAATAAS